MLIHLHDYDTDYYPAIPVIEIRVRRRAGQQPLTLKAIVDSGADATMLPVDVVAVPEGGALGAAYLARVTAGLEASAADAARWAVTGRRVEPDPAWVAPMGERYERFRALTGSTAER